MESVTHALTLFIDSFVVSVPQYHHLKTCRSLSHVRFVSKRSKHLYEHKLLQALIDSSLSIYSDIGVLFMDHNTIENLSLKVFLKDSWFFQ